MTAKVRSLPARRALVLPREGFSRASRELLYFVSRCLSVTCATAYGHLLDTQPAMLCLAGQLVFPTHLFAQLALVRVASARGLPTGAPRSTLQHSRAAESIVPAGVTQFQPRTCVNTYQAEGCRGRVCQRSGARSPHGGPREASCSAPVAFAALEDHRTFAARCRWCFALIARRPTGCLAMGRAGFGSVSIFTLPLRSTIDFALLHTAVGIIL